MKRKTSANPPPPPKKWQVRHERLKAESADRGMRKIEALWARIGVSVLP